MHMQECFANLGYKAGAFPESERAAQTTVALPVYPEVTDEQARYVVHSIAECQLIGAQSGASATNL